MEQTHISREVHFFMQIMKKKIKDVFYLVAFGKTDVSLRIL